jgi:hypothetical protein
MTTPRSMTESELLDLLVGEWMIGATNFPMWLNGSRLSPTFEYGLRGESPLVLDDTVAYLTADGARKTITGVDRWRGDRFVWRGTGLLRLFTSGWTVAAASDEKDFAVIRFTKSLATPAGVDVIARAGVTPHDLRTAVAADPERFTLGHEEFAGLTWLEFGSGSAAAVPTD